MTLRRLRAGGSRQSATNTIRNTTALLGHAGRYDTAALLIGWLNVGQGVVGTPGTRQYPEGLAAQLPNLLADHERLLHRGASCTLGEIVELSLGELDHT